MDLRRRWIIRFSDARGASGRIIAPGSVRRWIGALTKRVVLRRLAEGEELDLVFHHLP